MGIILFVLIAAPISPQCTPVVLIRLFKAGVLYQVFPACPGSSTPGCLSGSPARLSSGRSGSGSGSASFTNTSSMYTLPARPSAASTSTTMPSASFSLRGGTAACTICQPVTAAGAGSAMISRSTAALAFFRSCAFEAQPHLVGVGGVFQPQPGRIYRRRVRVLRAGQIIPQRRRPGDLHTLCAAVRFCRDRSQPMRRSQCPNRSRPAQSPGSAPHLRRAGR